MKSITPPLILVGILSGSATAQVSVSYFTPGTPVGATVVDTGSFFLSTISGEPWGHLPYNTFSAATLTTANTAFPFSTQGYTYELRGGGSLSLRDARNNGQITIAPEYSGDGFNLTGEGIHRGPMVITTIDPTTFTDPRIVIGNLPVGATVSFSMLAFPDNPDWIISGASDFTIGGAPLGPNAGQSFQTSCEIVPESGEIEFPLMALSGDPTEEFEYYFEAGRLEVCTLPVPEPSSALLLGLSVLGLTARRKR